MHIRTNTCFPSSVQAYAYTNEWTDAAKHVHTGIHHIYIYRNIDQKLKWPGIFCNWTCKRVATTNRQIEKEKKKMTEKGRGKRKVVRKRKWKDVCWRENSSQRHFPWRHRLAYNHKIGMCLQSIHILIVTMGTGKWVSVSERERERERERVTEWERERDRQKEWERCNYVRWWSWQDMEIRTASQNTVEIIREAQKKEKKTHGNIKKNRLKKNKKELIEYSIAEEYWLLFWSDGV